MSLLAAFAGKYAAFIWPAYGFCALLFAWMIGDTLVRARYWRGQSRRWDDPDGADT
jgi:heme exporter protein D